MLSMIDLEDSTREHQFSMKSLWAFLLLDFMDDHMYLKIKSTLITVGQTQKCLVMFKKMSQDEQEPA